MFLVTCYKTDCPSPHFYVNPQAGKIPLIASLKSPEGIQSLPNLTTNKFAAIQKIHAVQNSQDRLSKEDMDVIKELYRQMQEQIADKNLSFTVIEKKPKFKDYLVMQCESNHKNYIPLEDDPDYNPPVKGWWKKFLNTFKS